MWPDPQSWSPDGRNTNEAHSFLITHIYYGIAQDIVKLYNNTKPDIGIISSGVIFQNITHYFNKT